MVQTLKKRRDFLAANQGRRAHTSAFVLLMRDREDEQPPRVGYTCSKKVGNAVARNRAKRRLRALARDIIGTRGKSGHDYVLIGRRDTTARTPYNELVQQLHNALDKVQP